MSEICQFWERYGGYFSWLVTNYKPWMAVHGQACMTKTCQQLSKGLHNALAFMVKFPNFFFSLIFRFSLKFPDFFFSRAGFFFFPVSFPLFCLNQRDSNMLWWVMMRHCYVVVSDNVSGLCCGEYRWWCISFVLRWMRVMIYQGCVTANIAADVSALCCGEW